MAERAATVSWAVGRVASVLVVAGGLLIQFKGMYWIDPVITVIISIYIIREAFVILKEALGILMQSAPDHLNLDKMKRRIEEIPDVHNIHHLHVWMLTDQQVHFEAHVELLKDMKLSQVKNIQQAIEKMLKREFSIKHITLQFEYHSMHATHLIQKEEEK